jgi:hypothetical protein
MRAVSILAAFAVPVLIALTLVPETAAYHFQLTVAALAVAGVVLLTLLLSGRANAPAPAARAEAARPPAPPAAAPQAEAEVAGFLATLQERGRLVDFLMDDVAAYSDAQVGVAARVVHEGCRAVLLEHFRIRPIREEPEGSPVTVAPGYAADEYRLIGKISGSAPFSGRLVHRGWRTDTVKLPRAAGAAAGRLPAIAPAEVELK